MSTAQLARRVTGVWRVEWSRRGMLTYTRRQTVELEIPTSETSSRFIQISGPLTPEDAARLRYVTLAALENAKLKR